MIGTDLRVFRDFSVAVSSRFSCEGFVLEPLEKSLRSQLAAFSSCCVTLARSKQVGKCPEKRKKRNLRRRIQQCLAFLAFLLDVNVLEGHSNYHKTLATKIATGI
jgi:hypothetical protein